MAGVVIGVALLAGVAMPASAATIDELLAQIAILQSQLIALQGSTSTSCNFTVNLKMGQSHAEIKALQQYLNSHGAQISASGAGSPGNETMFFGGLTKAAVMKWQNMNAASVLTPAGLSASAGFWGSFSRAFANSTCGTGTTTGTGTVTPPATGGISVSAGTQPANSLAIAHATTAASKVPFTKFTVTAGSADATLNSVVVERTGLGADTNFDSVVLLDENDTQIGITKTLNSDHRATIGDKVVIKAGTSMTFTVAGNMTAGGSAGQVVALSVVAVNASGSVTGSFPITGAMHTINTSLSIGSVTMARGAFDPGSAQTKEVGVTGYNFTSIKVTAGSAEDMYMKSIRWNQTGSAGTTDVGNVMTIVDAVSYPTVISSDGKYYTTVFPTPGLLMAKGGSKDITVKGDIIGGSNRTIAFDVAKRIDVSVKGKDNGFYSTPPQTNSCGATTGTSCFTSTEDPWYDASVVTISAGTINVSSWTAGVAASNIAENLSDQAIAGFIVDVKGEAISVGSIAFRVALEGTATAAFGLGDVTNVKLIKDDGTVLSGPVDGSGATTKSGTITLTNSITFPTGITKIKLVGKMGTDAANNDTIAASTTPSSDWTTVKGQTTGNTITPAPASGISGPTQTIKAGSLTITVSTLPPAQTVIAGSKQFTFANYIMDSTQSGEDVRLTTVPLYYDKGAGNRNDLTNCQLYDGATTLTTGSNVKNPASTDTASSTTMTFDGTGLTITKGTSKTLALKCDVATGATSNYWWGIDADAFTATANTASGITSGTSITITSTDSVGQRMTSATGGSYTVVAATDSSVYYRQFNAGATDLTLAKFIFTAGTAEDIDLKQIAMQLGNVASNSPADLLGLEVSVWNGTTKVGTAQFGSGDSPDNATSTLTTVVRIPRGESVTLTVKGSPSAHDGITGTPGAFLAITYDGNNNGSATLAAGNYATGASSGSTIGGGTTSDVTTNGGRIFRSAPSVTVLSSGCSSCLAVSADLYKIRISAGSRGMAIDRVSFTVTSIGLGTISGWQLFGPAGAVNATGVATGTAANTGSRVVVKFDASSADSLIDAGTSKDYVLRASTITGITSTAVETINIQLLQDSAFVLGGGANTLMGTMGAASSSLDSGASTSDRFLWSPFSTTTPGVTTAANRANLDWTNSYGMAGYPSASTDFAIQSFSH